MTKPKFILLFSGKRKSGKDFITEKLLQLLGTNIAEIIRISDPIKSHWAEEKSLDLNQLLSDNPYKEKYRKEMIDWSDSVRKQNPAFFCEAAFKTVTKEIIIVSDVRRKTDILYFQSLGLPMARVRIIASEDVRQARGWKFVSGVDDVASECDLDDYKDWQMKVHNNGDEDVDDIVERIKLVIQAETKV